MLPEKFIDLKDLLSDSLQEIKDFKYIERLVRNYILKPEQRRGYLRELREFFSESELKLKVRIFRKDKKKQGYITISDGVDSLDYFVLSV